MARVAQKTARTPAVRKTAAKQAATSAPIVFVRTGDVREIPFEKGMTVTAAFQKLGYNFKDADEVRLNNKKLTKKDGGQALKPGDQLMVVGVIAGA